MKLEYIGSLSVVNLEQKSQREDCFVQVCCQLSDYQMSYGDYYKYLRLCFSIKPAAISTDVLNLCNKHNFTYYNLLKLHSKC